MSVDAISLLGGPYDGWTLDPNDLKMLQLGGRLERPSGKVGMILDLGKGREVYRFTTARNRSFERIYVHEPIFEGIIDRQNTEQARRRSGPHGPVGG